MGALLWRVFQQRRPVLGLLLRDQGRGPDHPGRCLRPRLPARPEALLHGLDVLARQHPAAGPGAGHRDPTASRDPGHDHGSAARRAGHGGGCYRPGRRGLARDRAGGP